MDHPNDTRGERKCPDCGAIIPADAPDGLCPACVFTSLMNSDPMPDSRSASRPAQSPSEAALGDDTLLEDGDIFGSYRIGRLLGRGGMGEVYEAEHVGNGRRVALKVLNERLTSADDRRRFLNEGQLAASINHPHTVYIYGSEEIEGLPVIAMELLPGGTLKDRVKALGPLPAGEAVDAILQVIAGLDAASAKGILHRDVKPSNCFVDRDGKIKVGDFGLSISSLAAQAASPSSSSPGVFHGTPQFASPEQRQGKVDLDVRSDIYSVGATLFYLLTGRPPIEVLGPESGVPGPADRPLRIPRDVRRRMPASLAAVVERCLARDRDFRPRSYADLAASLHPFIPGAAVPAATGLRVVAAAIDAILLVNVIGQHFFPMMLLYARRSGLTHNAGSVFLAAMLLPAVGYWSLLEGLGGRALGKFFCRLRVTTTAGRPPGVVRGLARAAMFVMPAALAVALTHVYPPALRHAPWSWPSTFLTGPAMYGLLFSTARRRNGWSGLHDRLTGTRVVAARRALLQPAVAPIVASAPGPVIDRLGPYDVIAPIGATNVGEMFRGFDPALKRPVWLLRLSAGAPGVSPRVRDLSRPGRLHWLGGQRTAQTNWDAYEAVEGQPFVARDQLGSLSWQTARPWLLDLARELDACERDDSLDSVTVSPERVWITADGRAKLLDFHAPGVPKVVYPPHPGAPDDPAPLAPHSAQLFLHTLARLAVGLMPMPRLPLSATAFLDRLASDPYPTLGDVADVLERLDVQPVRVSFGQRCLTLSPDVVVAPIGAGVFGLVLAPFALHFIPGWSHLRVTNGELGALGFAALGLAWAIALRGGFWLRACGIAVVMDHGDEVSRARAAARALVAWSWVPVQVAALVLGWSLLTAPIWLIKVGAVVWAAVSPERGLQDRIAGTYLVPR